MSHFRFLRLLIISVTISSRLMTGSILPRSVSNSTTAPTDHRNPSYLVSGQNGAVATEDERCSNIGVYILKDNGTATDAAIAAALCVGVVNCFSSGIGGGGFMVVKPPPCRSRPGCVAERPFTVDFRETLTTDAAYYNDQVRLDPSRSQVGGLAVGVPGELAGFAAAYKRSGGGVTWSRIFEPVIELAQNFTVGEILHKRIYADGETNHSIWMKTKPEWREVFFPPGRPVLHVGDYIQRPAYARTLETIAREGIEPFYKGTIAAELVATINRTGGRAQLADFAAYEALVRPALNTTYQGRTVWTTDAPSSGPMLLYLLNILEGYKLADEGRTPLSEHRFVEALKYTFARRTELGDPAFLNTTQRARIEQISSKPFGVQTRQLIDDARTYGFEHYKPHYDVVSDHGTTHLSVVDRTGSTVALTSTINLIFGSREMDRATGVVLNDENDDFSLAGQANYFNLAASPLNYPEKRKRPVSSIAPIIVDDAAGELVCSLGASGGSRIFSAIINTFLKLDWGYDLSHAIEDPRIHHQLLPNVVVAETSYRTDFLTALRSKGHNITMIDILVGQSAVHGVLRRSTDGMFFASSDSRKHGVPDAY